MDQLPVWVDTFARTLESALQHGALLALILGYVVAIGLTQWIKQYPWYPTHRWMIRLLALPFGFFPTYFVWPVHGFNAVRFFISLAVGVSAPWVYQIVTFLLYKKWPQLEQRLSAAPKPGDGDPPSG